MHNWVTKFALACEPEEKISLFSSLFFMGYMAGALLFVPLADRVGRKPVTIATGLGGAFVCLALALVAGGTSSPRTETAGGAVLLLRRTDDGGVVGAVSLPTVGSSKSDSSDEVSLLSDDAVGDDRSFSSAAFLSTGALRLSSGTAVLGDDLIQWPTSPTAPPTTGADVLVVPDSTIDTATTQGYIAGPAPEIVDDVSASADPDGGKNFPNQSESALRMSVTSEASPAASTAPPTSPASSSATPASSSDDAPPPDPLPPSLRQLQLSLTRLYHDVLLPAIPSQIRDNAAQLPNEVRQLFLRLFHTSGLQALLPGLDGLTATYALLFVYGVLAPGCQLICLCQVKELVGVEVMGLYAGIAFGVENMSVYSNGLLLMVLRLSVEAFFLVLFVWKLVTLVAYLWAVFGDKHVMYW